MGRVDGKVAFISGVARGQGRSHAIRLAEEGADIIGVDICQDLESNNYPLSRPEDLAQTVKEVEARGRRIVTSIVDVRDRLATKQAIDEGVAAFGGQLDVVVANAAICALGPASITTFLDTVQVDFTGVLNVIDGAMPHLKSGASIIATGSVLALRAGGTDSSITGPGGGAYTWAKRAVSTLIHDLAKELAPSGIRANVIHPTSVNTDMLHNQGVYKVFRTDLDAPALDDVMDGFYSNQPMPVPWIEPIDISNAVLFLASDESRYVTGLQMKVDAGSMLREQYRG
jgi:SDR family mycofactocin-dependent oxidoreductase